MSIKRPFTALNGKQIRKDYPKTFKSIRQWMERCGEIEGNVITEEMMMAFFYGNPRFLYDYFDDMGYQISILSAEHGFFHELLERSDWCRTATGASYPTRKEVEEAVFNRVFTLIESKL